MAAKDRKAKGTRNERRSREWLEGLGYYVVRAAGSHGTWDLVGIWVSDDNLPMPAVQLVQVKTNRAPSAAEFQAMRALRLPSYVQRFVHVWHDRQRQPEVIEVK